MEDESQSPTPAAGKPRRFSIFLLGVSAGAFGAAVLLSSAAFWYVNRTLSSGLEGLLRTKVFAAPGARFDSADVNLLSGRVSLKGVAAGGDFQGRWSWSLGLEKAAAKFSLKDLAEGGASIRRITVHKPVLELSLSSASASQVSDSAGPGAGGPGLRPVWASAISIGEFAAVEGVLRLSNAAGGKPLEFDDVSIEVERTSPGGTPLSLRASGRLGKEDAAKVALAASLRKPGDPCESEGDLKLQEIPIPALAAFFPPDPDIRFLKGRLTLTTHFVCKQGWVSASHHFEIDGFKMEVAEGVDEVYGLPVKYAKALFDIESLSFVVPMNGSLENPHIGVRSTVEQILFKILQGEYKNPEKAEKLAKRGGAYFGKKIDKALRDWAARSKRK